MRTNRPAARPGSVKIRKKFRLSRRAKRGACASPHLWDEGAAGPPNGAFAVMSSSKPPPLHAHPRNLVLRKVPDWPALPVVRPPPRPSQVSLMNAVGAGGPSDGEHPEPRPGSLPPVAASVPPPPSPAGTTGLARGLRSDRLLMASGFAAMGAMVAVVGGLLVGRTPVPQVATPVAAHVAASLLPAQRVETRVEGTVADSTPWVEVPVPVMAPPPAPSAQPVAHRVERRTLGAHASPVRAVTAENSASAATRATTRDKSGAKAGKARVDPVLKAVQDEIRDQQASEP